MNSMMNPSMVPYVNARGDEYFQLFQHYPILSPFYTEFEKNYSTLSTQQWVADNTHIPVIIVVCYGLFAYFGQKFMANRKAFDLTMPLAYWNLFLSMFSFLGMIRTVPHLLNMLSLASLDQNLCTNAISSFGDGACGLWIQLFVLSKIPELMDTVFIVLRKKPLIFLHWYHHITVLLFCWHCFATEASTGLFFVAMNYSVHAVMYGYYFLMAMKMKPVWMKPIVITLAQISQMLVGTSLCVMTMFLLRRGEASCSVKKENVIAGGLMYGSYLYLFAEFAVKRFILAPAQKKKMVEKKVN
jgi:elongation of very long chain fatty acids protein 6